MKTLLFLFLVSLIFVQTSAAQTEDLLKKIDLTFYLDAEPETEDVGFSNPKSNWKIDYQLYLSDWKTLEKIGRCGVRQDANSKAYCSHTTGKKLDKKSKKLSSFISAGKFEKTALSEASNRTFTIPVELSAQAIAEFNEAAKVYDKNPVLIFYVKAAVSTKNSAGKKLKKKYRTEGAHFLKFYLENKTFDYFNLSKLSFGLTIVKNAKGELELRTGYTHFGT